MVATEGAARGLPTNLVYVADSDQPVAAAVMAASVARLGGLLILTPGADLDVADAALAAVDLASPVDRLVVVNTAASGTSWLPIVLVRCSSSPGRRSSSLPCAGSERPARLAVRRRRRNPRRTLGKDGSSLSFRSGEPRAWA